MFDSSILTASQEELADVFNNNPGVSLNTFELRSMGISYPAQRVAELRRKGALVDCIRKQATDSFGKRHSRIAHYTFRGWRDE